MAHYNSFYIFSCEYFLSVTFAFISRPSWNPDYLNPPVDVRDLFNSILLCYSIIFALFSPFYFPIFLVIYDCLTPFEFLSSLTGVLFLNSNLSDSKSLQTSWPSWLRQQTTLTASLNWSKTLRTSVPDFDTKQSDGVTTLMFELWEIQSTHSLPLLPGPLWPGVVAIDRVLSMCQIELNSVITLNWIVWN